MSSTTQPISPTRFAAALTDLPVSSLYAKVAELRNSLTHLVKSNQELLPYAQEGDQDCADAIKENEDVIDRMRHRILLIEYEVEVTRSMKWDPEAIDQKEPGESETIAPVTTTAAAASTNGTSTGSQNGRLSDEELRRRIEERMNMDENGDENNDDGVHL